MIFTQTRRSRQTSSTADSDYYTRQRRATNTTNMNLRQGLRDKARIAVSFRDPIWHDTYGAMYVANLATKNNFWSRKTIFLRLGAKKSSHAGLVRHSHAMHSRTDVFLHDVILCPDASVILQRKPQTVNWLLRPGQRSRLVVFQVQVTCHLHCYHSSLHERSYVGANVVNCKHSRRISCRLRCLCCRPHIVVVYKSYVAFSLPRRPPSANTFVTWGFSRARVWRFLISVRNRCIKFKRHTASLVSLWSRCCDRLFIIVKTYIRMMAKRGTKIKRHCCTCVHDSEIYNNRSAWLYKPLNKQLE